MVNSVCELTDENLNFKYDVLEQLINELQLDDVPIVIYSISGPTRTGKSYLLNILHYLMKQQQSQVKEDETEEQGIPQLFQSEQQPKPVTKGIFMTSKPIFMETSGTKKIAVFLMDTQGIDAGDKIESKEADLFTVSSTLSFMQIINTKHIIGFPIIDNYAALAYFASRLEIVTETSNKLMMVVRDWEILSTHQFGHAGGQDYFESLRFDPSLKNQIQCLRNYYGTRDCFLVPHPGNAVARKNSKLRRDLDPETLMCIDDLYKLLFSQNNIRNAAQTMLKGKEFLALAKEVTDKLASRDRLLLPEGSFKSFLDIVMKTEVSGCAEHYEELMKPHTDLEGKELNLEHEKMKKQATNMLLNNKACDISEYKELLHRCINTKFQIIKGRQLLPVYGAMWAENIKKKGNFAISEVTDFFKKEGEKYKEKIRQKISDDEAQKVVILEFIAVLGDLFELEMKRRNKNKLIAICCGATIGGLAGGIGLAFIPPIVAIATSAALATEAGLAMAATGLGLAGGTAAGSASALATKLLEENPKPSDLNDDDTVDEKGNVCVKQLKSIMAKIQNKRSNK